jgi:hypothetical protein
MRFEIRLRACACTALLLLTACASTPPPQPVAESAQPPRDLVAEVYAAALDGNDGIEVQPLPDARVADLRERAQRLRDAGEIDAADLALQQALEITPENPELLQQRAELALVREAFEEAEQLAARSYELGPRLGGLCRRNWATVRLSREMRGMDEAAGIAAEQGQRCTIEPPVRM